MKYQDFLSKAIDKATREGLEIIEKPVFYEIIQRIENLEIIILKIPKSTDMDYNVTNA